MNRTHPVNRFSDLLSIRSHNRFATPRTGDLDVVVYDVMGRVVETLVSGELSAGWHDISFSAGRFSSGLYLYTVRFEGRQLTGRMNLIK